MVQVARNTQGTTMAKRLEYWKEIGVPNKPWITYMLVPLTVIQESVAFDAIVELVREANFSYRVIETTEKVTETNVI